MPEERKGAKSVTDGGYQEHCGGQREADEVHRGEPAPGALAGRPHSTPLDERDWYQRDQRENDQHRDDQ